MEGWVGVLEVPARPEALELTVPHNVRQPFLFLIQDSTSSSRMPLMLKACSLFNKNISQRRKIIL